MAAHKSTHTGKTLQGPGKLLDETWKTLTSRYQQFLLVTLPIVIASFLSSLTTRAYTPQNLPPFSSLFMLVLTLVLAAITILGAIALLYTAAGSIEPVEAYKKGLNKFFPYLGIEIVYGIIVFIGTILLVVPGILFGIWFCLSGYIVIFENKSILDALSQSKKYVTGHWWGILGRIIILVLVLIAISIVGSLVATILRPLHLSFLPALVRAVVDLLIVPVGVIYMYSLYKNLKGLN